MQYFTECAMSIVQMDQDKGLTSKQIHRERITPFHLQLHWEEVLLVVAQERATAAWAI
jgi:hypothetical protein